MTLASAASASREAISLVVWSQKAFGLQPGILALIAALRQLGSFRANVGLKDWVLPAAILIVGNHFFPLAKAYGNPQLVISGTGNPVGCLAAGIMLWASAIRSLVCRLSI